MSRLRHCLRARLNQRLGERVEALAFEVLPAPVLARVVRRRCSRRRAQARKVSPKD